MSAYDTGKMVLFIQSILWDLNIPQEVATLLYEGNNACTAMANAQKPTPRTRHSDIKYFSLSEWVERDLMVLEQIDASINLLITLPRVFNRISFIDIPILSSVTFLRHIHQYIVQLSGDMSQMMNMSRSLFLAHSLPH
jgi:hypothetical protein